MVVVFGLPALADQRRTPRKACAPETGTELAISGSRLGSIDEADVASVYFRIWFGDSPVDTRRRDQLLGCDRRDGENTRAAAPRVDKGVP